MAAAVADYAPDVDLNLMFANKDVDPNPEHMQIYFNAWLTPAGAHEEQAGDVRADDEQHERHRAEQQEQPRTHLADDRVAHVLDDRRRGAPHVAPRDAGAIEGDAVPRRVKHRLPAARRARAAQREVLPARVVAGRDGPRVEASDRPRKALGEQAGFDPPAVSIAMVSTTIGAVAGPNSVELLGRVAQSVGTPPRQCLDKVDFLLWVKRGCREQQIDPVCLQLLFNAIGATRSHSNGQPGSCGNGRSGSAGRPGAG